MVKEQRWRDLFHEYVYHNVLVCIPAHYDITLRGDRFFLLIWFTTALNSLSLVVTCMTQVEIAICSRDFLTENDCYIAASIIKIIGIWL